MLSIHVKLLGKLAGFYRASLSRFYVFRLLKEVLVRAYRAGAILHSRVCRVGLSGHYVFRSMSSLPDTLVTRRMSIAPEKTTVIPAPGFSGFAAKIAASQNGAITLQEPALDIIELPPSTVVGGADFIFCSGMAIHHDLFEPAMHQCPAQNVGVIAFDTDRQGLNLYLARQPVQVEAAISLIGQCSGNYAHWLTESLPKLALADTCSDYADLPLLVDEGLHPNIHASLELININRRKIITVSRWSPVMVERLVCLSCPGYERYAPMSLSMLPITAYVNRFSSFALKLLRERVLAATAPAPQEGGCYLARSQNSKNLRQVANLEAVEALLGERGFAPCWPDSASFIEQVQACRGRRAIAAPVGASLANMIFCEPGTHIIVLSPFHEGASFYYYSNLAGVLGHRITYVLGAQENLRKHPSYRNYAIDLRDLGATLQQHGLAR